MPDLYVQSRDPTAEQADLSMHAGYRREGCLSGLNCTKSRSYVRKLDFFQGNTRVRRLDWIDALPLDSQAAIMQEDLIAGRVPELDGPPTLPTNEKFPVVIGSDLMYEVGQILE